MKVNVESINKQHRGFLYYQVDQYLIECIDSVEYSNKCHRMQLLALIQ